MTTITATYTSYKPPDIKKILFILVICAIAVQLTFHALLKHNEAELVDQRCGDRRNILDFRRLDDRFYQICDMGDGSFGIRVLIRETEGVYRRVTSFVRKVHGKPVMDLKAIIEYIGGNSVPIP